MRCAFPACDHDSSQNSSPRVTFHRIPDEESLRTAWMEALGQTDWTPEPGSVVCSEHVLLMDLLGASTEHPLQLCRICFTTDCKMYSMTSFKMLSKAYETVTGILTAEEECLPRHLCGQCAGRLMKSARFRRRSLRAHSMLLDIVRTHGQINLYLIRSELQNYNTLSSDPADSSDGEQFEFDIKDLDNVIKQTDTRVDESPVDVKFTVDQNHIYGKDEGIDVAVDEFKTENEDLNNIEESHLQDIVSDSMKENIDFVNLAVKMEVIDRDSPGEYVLDDLTRLEGLGAKTMEKTRRVVNETEVDEQQTPEADGPSTDDTLLLEHLKAHAASKKRFHCDMCDYECHRKDKLISHLRTHLGNTKYFCEVCKNTFSSKKAVTLHMRSHFKGKCDVSNKTFSRRRYLKRHQIVHSSEKPYSCDVCNKVFKEKGDLTRHKLIHSNVKPHSCDVCNKMFRHKWHLQSHQLIHCKEKKYSCNVCNTAFRQKCDLRHHQLVHSNKNSYTCDLCNKVFRRKFTLLQHKLIHSNDKPYSCDICNKGFRKKGNLRRHQLIHSNEKSYSCDVCYKVFRLKQHLQTHQLIHSNDKPYFCDVCNKVFRQKFALRRHQLIHSNDKPYSCDICNKGFSQKCNLRRHQLIHSNKKRS